MDNILARARECQTTYAISARSSPPAASEATKWNQYLGVPVTVASTIVAHRSSQQSMKVPKWAGASQPVY